MALRRYSPPIERVKEEYSRMIARRMMRKKRGPRPEHPRTPDNSEPWIANPKNVDDLWEIAQCVQRRVDEFQKWRQLSSNS